MHAQAAVMLTAPPRPRAEQRIRHHCSCQSRTSAVARSSLSLAHAIFEAENALASFRRRALRQLPHGGRLLSYCDSCHTHATVIVPTVTTDSCTRALVKADEPI